MTKSTSSPPRSAGIPGPLGRLIFLELFVCAPSWPFVTFVLRDGRPPAEANLFKSNSA